MQIFRTVKELKSHLATLEGDLGYVATMGALHDGHASLIKKSLSQNTTTIVSTFVNPTQFLPGEDLDKYPRNESGDRELCENLGVDIMFIPTPDELYFDDEPLICAPKNLCTILEGATRPGHFDGVCMVINKFFNIIRPNRAYFGKKDAQQLIIIQNLAKTFFTSIDVIGCEIVRESDGLALSSRNAYLDENEKLLALKLSRALAKASNLITSKEVDVKLIKEQMLKILEPLKIDYVAFVNREFAPITKLESENSIILIAAHIGKTRLIDNLWI